MSVLAPSSTSPKTPSPEPTDATTIASAPTSDILRQPRSPKRTHVLSPIEAEYRRPWAFLGLALTSSWALWIPGAMIANAGNSALATLLLLAGLVAPMGVVLAFTRGRPYLRRDIAARLSVRGVPAGWLLLATFAMPIAVVVATLVSLPLGYSLDQFLPRDAATFTVGVISPWIVLVLAPILEEMAWHSYGMDALRTRYSLLSSSLIFGLVWAAWHVPLAFVEGSSQANTAQEGILHALNFPLSMIPFVILVNWIYVRTDRNIIVTILFHLGANLSTQVLSTHADTELIVTALLLPLTAYVVWRDRALFLASPVPALAR